MKKDILIRALKTFTQTFLATAATGVAGVTNISTLKALLIAAGAAGISAVWNALLSNK